MSELSRVYLRGVNLTELTDKYLSGEFVQLIDPLPINPEILNEQAQSIVTYQEPVISTSYETRLGTGRNFACIGYRVSERDGHYTRFDPQQKYRCMNCLKKIDQDPWGIPIKREQVDDKYYYHTVDIFCGPECTLRKINERIHNTVYSSSLCFLFEMYEHWTGQKASELKPASDPRLLKKFNGPLSWDEYHKMSSVYTEKPSNIFLQPVLECIEQD